MNIKFIREAMDAGRIMHIESRGAARTAGRVTEIISVREAGVHHGFTRSRQNGYISVLVLDSETLEPTPTPGKTYNYNARPGKTIKVTAREVIQSWDAFLDEQAEITERQAKMEEENRKVAQAERVKAEHLLTLVPSGAWPKENMEARLRDGLNPHFSRDELISIITAARAAAVREYIDGLV